MTEPTRHDWPKIIGAILDVGITRYRLSVMCGVDKNTIKAWANGDSEPRHFAGELILELHADVSHGTTGDSHHAVQQSE